jgi:hypothetical protein
MTYRYKFHCRGLALVVLVTAALASAAPLTLDQGWIPGIAVTAVAVLAASTALVCERKRARRLGRLELDDQGVKRVRGDGRVVERMRWADLRAVVYDDRRRLLLFQGKDATGLWCSGPLVIGGVGLEKFGRLLEDVGRRTGLPLTPAAGAAPRTPPPTTDASARLDQTAGAI